MNLQNFYIYSVCIVETYRYCIHMFTEEKPSQMEMFSYEPVIKFMMGFSLQLSKSW